MADQMDDADFQFEPAPEGDVDFEFLAPGQQAPEPEKPKEPAAGVTLTPEQYAEILKGSNPSEAITKGLGQLVEKIATQAPANGPAQAPVDDYDPNKIENDLFVAGKGVPAIEKVVQRVLGSVQGQFAVQMQQQNKRLLKVDPKTGEYFTQFEGEIERRVQTLPPQFRFQPDIYERVYQQVLMEKQPEIIQSETQKQIQAAVAKALEEAGVKPGAKAPAGGVRNEIGNSVVGGSAAAMPKKKVYLTAADREDMADSMMDPNDKSQVKAYLKSKGRL